MTSEDIPHTAESFFSDSPLFEAKLPDGNAPKYHRLASFLKKFFIDRSPAHAPLPTERELQEQFGVSRDTVRRAVSVLQQKGLVYNIQGSGTYTADLNSHKKEPRAISYTEDMRGRGFTPSTATMGTHRISATAKLAQDLEIAEGSPLIEVVRLRRADNEPMCFEKARFIPEAFNDLNPGAGTSLDQLLIQNGYFVVQMQVRVSAVNLSYEEAAALSVPPNTAGLRVERVGYTDRGKAVESTLSVYRADRYNFEFELRR